MTKGAALQAFFSQFMDAYAASAVPEDVAFPYLTYELITSAWDGGEVGLTVNMWFYTTSQTQRRRNCLIPLDMAALRFRATVGLSGSNAAPRGARTFRTILTPISNGGTSM